MQTCIGTSTGFLENTVMKDYKDFGKLGEMYSEDATTFENYMVDIHARMETLQKAMDEIVQSQMPLLQILSLLLRLSPPQWRHSVPKDWSALKTH